MRDFDTERAERLGRDRDFKIGGEEFRRRAGVRPETVVRYFSIVNVQNEDFIEEMDAVLLDFLEPDCHQRFIDRRKDEVDPITFADVQELVKWLIEEETRRPTSPSSGFSAGREEKDETNSTVGSPSTEPTSTVSS